MRNDIETTPAETLRIFRAANGWSQTDAGQAAQVTRETISRIERGGTPSASTARRLAEALGCDVEMLIPAQSNGTPAEQE